MMMMVMVMKTKRGPQRTVVWRQKHQHDRIQTNTYRQKKIGLVMVETKHNANSFGYTLL